MNEISKDRTIIANKLLEDTSVTEQVMQKRTMANDCRSTKQLEEKEV